VKSKAYGVIRSA